MSLSRFDEMSEVVRETGTSPAEKAVHERKKFAEYIRTFVACIQLCVTIAGKAKLSLEVKM